MWREKKKELRKITTQIINIVELAGKMLKSKPMVRVRQPPRRDCVCKHRDEKKTNDCKRRNVTYMKWYIPCKRRTEKLFMWARQSQARQARRRNHIEKSEEQ